MKKSLAILITALLLPQLALAWGYIGHKTIAEIAEQCGVSECYFRRLFQEYSGESPMNFRQRYRIEKAKQLLLSDEHYTVGEIAEMLGFSDIYHFSKTFKKHFGLSPREYIKENQK